MCYILSSGTNKPNTFCVVPFYNVHYAIETDCIAIKTYISTLAIRNIAILFESKCLYCVFGYYLWSVYSCIKEKYVRRDCANYPHIIINLDAVDSV